MTPRKKAATSAELETSMMFLVGHGLQSPLSAIRWGIGRLKRGRLSEEQQGLLGDIQRETRLLSDMFDALLLLAKAEEGVHEPSMQDVIMRDFLLAETAKESIAAGKMPFRVICPENLRIRADRPLFETTVHSMLLAAAVSAAQGYAADVTAGSDGKRCVITVNAKLNLTLLQEQGRKRDIVGGVPGFLLAVASTLAPKIGGRLEPLRDAEKNIRGLQLRLPIGKVSS